MDEKPFWNFRKNSIIIRYKMQIEYTALSQKGSICSDTFLGTNSLWYIHGLQNHFYIAEGA